MRRLNATVFRTAQVALMTVALATGGSAMAETGKSRQEPRRITLVGASIGKAWHFDKESGGPRTCRKNYGDGF